MKNKTLYRLPFLNLCKENEKPNPLPFTVLESIKGKCKTKPFIVYRFCICVKKHEKPNPLPFTVFEFIQENEKSKPFTVYRFGICITKKGKHYGVAVFLC